MTSGIKNGVDEISKKVITDEAKTLANAFSASLKDRFGNLEANSIFSIAAYLDPRFKKKAFSSGDCKKMCCDRIVRQMEKILVLPKFPLKNLLKLKSQEERHTKKK